MEILISRDGSQLGPYTLDKVKELLAANELSLRDLCWYHGCMDWAPISALPGIVPPPPSPQSSPPAIPPADPASPVPVKKPNRVLMFLKKSFMLVGGIIFCVVVIVTIAAMIDSVSTRSAMHEANANPPTPPPQPALPPAQVSEISTTWRLASRGITVMDGQLWVPRLSMTVRNPSDTELKTYYRVLFLDEKGVIKAEEREPILGIPGKLAKGPIFVDGNTGFTNDGPFVEMATGKSKRWSYELDQGEGFSGPWVKVASGPVDIPEDYQREFGPQK